MLASARAARAGEPVRLEWVRLEGAGACIEPSTLEARVRQRLGSDPFDPRATRSIEGVVRRAGESWSAELAVRAHPNDVDPPRRELKSQARDCESLSEAVVLAVALAIDPTAALLEPPKKEPQTAPPAPPAPDFTPSPAAVWPGRAELALAGQSGLLPRASLGASLLAAAALTEHLELGLRATVFPAVDEQGDPSFATGLALGAVQVCARLPRALRIDLLACGGPSVGLMHATVLAGNRSQPGERAWFDAELGLDAVIPLTRSLGILVGARGAVPLIRYRFLVDGSNAVLFRQPALTGIAHVGVQLRFGAAR